MSLTPIIPTPEDLKRTMGSMPPLIQKPDNEAPPSGGLPSLGTLPPLGNSPPAQLPPSGLRPLVTNPRQDLENTLMQKIQSYENPAKPKGFWQNLGHVLAQNPFSMAYRNASNDQHLNQLAGLQGQDLAEREQTGKEGLEAAQSNYYNQHASQVGVRPMTADEAASIGHPELEGSLMDQKSISTLLGKHDTNQTRQSIADTAAQLRRDIASAKPEQRDDRAIRLNEKAALGEPLTQEENAYLGAYAKYIDQTKVQPGVARAQAFGMFRPVQILGPNGDVQYQFSGNAIRSGAATPQSMNFRTASGMAKFMTSGKGGQTITAYNTANDHLELLGKAMDALDNGDVQGLNQLDNAFKQQFGSAAPTNVNAVKAMLAGELANVAKVTGATDQEIQEQKDNINRASSPQQIRGFIDTNHDLMDQKAYEMYQQYQQGMQGQPAFNTGLSGHQPANGAGGGNQPKVLKFNATTGRLE